MKDVSSYDDPKELDQLMKNAKKLGREDVYWQAFRRRCELEGLDQSDPLHREFYQTLQAYEQLLSEKNGHTTKASRTRQKLSRHGVEQCLEDWALGSHETQGFTLLVENGMVNLTGEFLVTKYSDRFSASARIAAKERLLKVARDEKMKIDIAALCEEMGWNFDEIED